MTLRRVATFAVKLLGPALFLVVLARTDLAHLGASLRAAVSWPLAGALACYVPYALVRSARWRSLLALQQARYTLRRSVILYYAISFLGMLTPGRVGELARALYLKRDHGMSTGRAFAGAVMDRVHDVGMLLVVSLAFAVDPRGRSFVLVALAVFGAGLAGACVPSFGRLALRLAPLPAGLRARLTALAESYYAGLGDFATLAHLRAVGLTLTGGAVFLVMNWLLQRAVGVDLPFAATSGAVALGALASAVPVSFLGVGPRDAVIAAVYTQLGVPEPLAHAVAFSTVYLVVFSGLAALFGFLAHQADPLPVGVDVDPAAVPRP